MIGFSFEKIISGLQGKIFKSFETFQNFLQPLEKKLENNPESIKELLPLLITLTVILLFLIFSSYYSKLSKEKKREIKDIALGILMPFLLAILAYFGVKAGESFGIGPVESCSYGFVSFICIISFISLVNWIREKLKIIKRNNG